MEWAMKKFILAAVAALTLGAGVASAAQVQNNGLGQLPSSEFSYSPVNG